MFSTNNSLNQTGQEANQTGNPVPNLFANPQASSSNNQQSQIDTSNQGNQEISSQGNAGINIFGQSTTNQQNSNLNIFGNTNKQNQNVAQNAFSNNPILFQQPQNQTPQQTVQPPFQNPPLNIFSISNQKSNNENNIFFDPKNSSQSNLEGEGTKNLFQPSPQQQQPTLFSPTPSSLNQKTANESGNIFGSSAQQNIFGNATIPNQIGFNQNKSKSSSPHNLFINTQNINSQVSDKGNMSFPIPNSNAVSEIKPQKLQFQSTNNNNQINSNLGLFGVVPSEQKLNSPLFGGEMSPIQKKDDSERLIESNQVSVNKADIKNSQEGNRIETITDSVEKIDFNMNESEEDDQGLGDFSSKPFAQAYQIKKSEDRQQSRFESHRYDEDEDQNLRDFGPKDTRVAEQDLLVKNDQRKYQRIDIQKKLVDLEIENDYLKREVMSQKKTISELENRISSMLQDHLKAQKQLKDMYDVQLKRTEAMVSKSQEFQTNLEKKYAFDMIKMTLMRKAQQTKYDNVVDTLSMELQATKYEINNLNYQNEELCKENKIYQQQQKEITEFKKIKLQHSNLKERLHHLLVKQQRREEVRQSDSDQKQLPDLYSDNEILDILESRLKGIEKINKKQLEQTQLQFDKTQILLIDKQRLEYENERLDGLVKFHILNSAKLEENLRKVQGEVHAYANKISELTKENEDLKNFMIKESERQKDVIRDFQNAQKLHKYYFWISIVIFMGIAANFYLNSI